MSQHTDDVLDDIDAALDDYVEWHGSEDSASWAADGSHQVDTGGHYYASDDAFDWDAALWAEHARRFAQWADELFRRVRVDGYVYVAQAPRRSSPTWAIVDELGRRFNPTPVVEPEVPADPLEAIAAEGLRLAEAGEKARSEAFTAALTHRLALEGVSTTVSPTVHAQRAWESPWGAPRAGRRR